MNEKLVLIHTVSPLLDVFDRLVPMHLPGLGYMHILDEPLLERVRQRGQLAPEDSARLLEHVTIAEQAGARAVLITCSTVSPCVDDVRPKVSVPVVKIDEAMIAQAVAIGSRIGIVATNPTTLEPTRRLLRAQAEATGKCIATELLLLENALEALLSGDGGMHDQLVAEGVLALTPRADVIVLAQASMARALAVISQVASDVPVLSSPHLALEQVRSYFPLPMSEQLTGQDA